MKIAEDSPPTVSTLDRPNSYIGRSHAIRRQFGQ